MRSLIDPLCEIMKLGSTEVNYAVFCKLAGKFCDSCIISVSFSMFSKTVNANSVWAFLDTIQAVTHL